MEVEILVVSINQDLPPNKIITIMEIIKKIEGVIAVKTLERIMFEMHEK